MYFPSSKVVLDLILNINNVSGCHRGSLYVVPHDQLTFATNIFGIDCTVKSADAFIVFNGSGIRVRFFEPSQDVE